MSGWGALRLNVARLRQRDNLTELRARAAGAEILDLEATVEAEGIEITTARIPDGTPVRVTGRLEAGLSGLELHASVTSQWVGECRRCVEPVEGPVDIDVVASFVDDVDSADDEADAYPIEGDWVDVGAVVREELMLALPLSPLCREDCDGADPERFPTTGLPHDGDADEGEPAIDPRWAALSELTFDED